MRRPKEAQKQSKFLHYMLIPIRILSKAKDFYLKSMDDCNGRLGYGSMVVCPAPGPQVSSLPRSFSLNSSRYSGDEELRELLRTVSKRNTDKQMAGVGMERQGKQVVRQPLVYCNKEIIGRRRCGVGLGKIGRIDEDKPCNFEEEDQIDGKDLFSSARSRSCAMRRKVACY